MSIKCKLSGCDPDPCGICRRCGNRDAVNHDWAGASSDNPCYRRRVCSRCQEEDTKPDHDWTPVEGPRGTDLKCSRCGLQI